MVKKLEEISEIHFGPYEKGEEKGNIKYLLAGHFDEYYQPNNFGESYVELTYKNEKSLLKANDVVLAGKGQRMFAWSYDEQFGHAIPSSLFYIIRTNPLEVLGEYLAHFLNSDKIQYEIKLIASGGTVPSIPKSELIQLEVFVPSIEEQHRIVNIANLLEKDLILTQQLLNEKMNLKKGVINKLINQNTKKRT